MDKIKKFINYMWIIFYMKKGYHETWGAYDNIRILLILIALIDEYECILLVKL